MMQCQATDDDSNENVSDLLSKGSCFEDSAFLAQVPESNLQQEPAVLPCTQIHDTSQTQCHQTDMQQVTTCNNSPLHSQCQNSKTCVNENQQNERFSNSLEHKDSNELVNDVSSSSDLDSISQENSDAVKDQMTLNTSHEDLLNSNIPIIISNNAGDNEDMQAVLLASSSVLESEATNLSHKSFEQTPSNNCKQEKIDGNEKQPYDDRQPQNVVAGGGGDDDVEKLLQEIDSLNQSQGTCSNDDSRPVTDQQIEPNKELLSSNSGINETNHSGSSQSLSSCNAECNDYGQHLDDDDGIIRPVDQMSCDEIASTYDVLAQRFLLLKKRHEEQRIVQEKIEDDHKVASARLASVILERDKYLSKLNEFEDLNLVDSEDTKQLELTIEQQKQQILMLKEKLSNQEVASKQAMSLTQAEHKTQLDQLRKKYDDCEKDKQSMVMKYAQAEQKNIELQEKMNKMDGWLKDWSRQRDNLMGRLNATAAEKQKLTQLLENRATELVSLKKEIERQKEFASSQEMKAKWHQNKLKVELESHKETKSKIEELQQKLKESKEECEKVRQESQSVIKSFQMSQVMTTITKDLQLKETEEELLTQRLEQTEQKEVLQMVKQELDSLKAKEKELLEELNTYKDKVKCLEAERVLQEETLSKFKDTLQNQKKVNRELGEQIAELEALKPEAAELKQKLADAHMEIEELKQSNKDFASDMDGYINQESEHLKFSQRLSDEVVRLQSENLVLGDEIASLTNERESLKTSVSSLSSNCDKFETELKTVIQSKQHAVDELEKQLTEQLQLVEQHSKQLEEREDELRTLKRRHISSSKDLKRQLAQLQRRLEQYENKATNSTSTLSRTSSSGSLDSGSTSVNSKEPASGQQANSSNILTISDIDKEVLIDKIIKLQKSHARKNEKIEFMQDHINQLLEEVKKKSRIIQNYIMREESYSLVPAEVVTQTKTMPNKKSGIVTSMFVSSETGRDLYEDLVEHNSRLQTVLEDKVIHNLTLKSTVDTLGQEISHLSTENRRLQIEVQQLRTQFTQPSGQ